LPESGFTGLFDALKRGAALPAVAFAPLVRLLAQQEEGTARASERNRAIADEFHEVSFRPRSTQEAPAIASASADFSSGAYTVLRNDCATASALHSTTAVSQPSPFSWVLACPLE
jgi:hypothetical protein